MSDQELVIHNANAVTVSADFMPVFNIDMALERRNAMKQFVSKIMIAGTDYGKIPGTTKDVLLKPGAERLCSFFGLSPEFVMDKCIEDWTGKDFQGEPFFYYRYKCRLTRNGRLIGEGDGSSNSWEVKYRYRWVSEEVAAASVPDIGKLGKKAGSISEPKFAIDRSETGGKYGKPAEYWQSFKDAMASGKAKKVAKKKKDGTDMEAYEIDATMYRLPNPEVADVVNTLQKMAQKRALIAAVLIGVNASDYFTQDLDDMVESHSGPSDDDYARYDAEASAVENKRQADKQQPAQQEKKRPEPQYAQAADGSAIAVDPTPPVLLEAYKMLAGTDRFAKLKIFREFKKSLAELMGDESGLSKYYEILNHHGVQSSKDFKSVKPSQFAARDMYLAIQKAVAPVAKPYEASDSDIPEIIGGQSGARLFDTAKEAGYGTD